MLLEGWEHSESVIFKEVSFKTQTEPPLEISSEGQTSLPLPTKASTAEMSSSGGGRGRGQERESYSENLEAQVDREARLPGTYEPPWGVIAYLHREPHKSQSCHQKG